MTALRRRFRIETHPSAGFGHAPIVLPMAGETAAPAPDADMMAERHRELMDAIARLERAIEPHEKVSTHLVADYGNQIAEVRQLKAELNTVYEAIERTKKEIATLHANGFHAPGNARAADHLDAVVSGTEQATTSILSAAEEIDQIAAMLQVSLKETPDAELAEDIQHQVVKIFEACNFQDLTGQRITRVCTTFNFIEERVIRMMELWGGIESFQGIEPESLPPPDGDKAMLNGPALDDEGDRASQSDIDALFS